LTCIANLSNDEVFTPPELQPDAGHLAEAWAAANNGEHLADRSVRFSIRSRSRRILREIASRLTKGWQRRFLTFKSASITSSPSRCLALASLISPASWRRSLYCSKHADGPHSMPKTSPTMRQHLVRAMEHTWKTASASFAGWARRLSTVRRA